MRKLATIRQVSAFLPIPEADRIQIALVEGWRCVCKKEEFQVDEWVVYCEIDSFLPIRPEFEHLRKTSYKKVGDKEGFRLKTVKMRGQISQGLLLPLSVLDGKVNDENHTWNIGDDVTEILGITKWEDEQLSGHAMGPFPEGVPKTEAERIQNQTKEYQNLRTLTFHVTEKLDGSSCTMFWDGKRAGICSRNLEQLAGSDSPQRKWWDKHPEISQKLEALGKNYAVQGELVGHKIARNTYKFNDMRLFVFSVFDRDEMAYLDPQGVWPMPWDLIQFPWWTMLLNSQRRWKKPLPWETGSLSSIPKWTARASSGFMAPPLTACPSSRFRTNIWSRKRKFISKLYCKNCY